jgi:tetratricopeptide (TPR) repeat protein
MLETIREFGGERLAEVGETETVRAAHAAYYLSIAESAVPHLHGWDQDAWLDRLETEHGNFRAALEWAVDHCPDVAHRLGAALWLFWLKRGHWSEGQRWLERALIYPNTTPAYAEALLGAGSLLGVQGDEPAAEAYFARCLELWERIGSASGIARVLANTGIAAVLQADFTRAASLFRDALPRFDLPRDEPWAALATTYLGLVMVASGDSERGLALTEEGVERQRAIGERWAVANTSILFADALTLHGAYKRAAAVYEACLAEWTGNIGVGLWYLGGLGIVAAAVGRMDDTVRLAGAVDAACEQWAISLPNFLDARLAAATTSAKPILGEQVFAAAWNAGRELKPEGILAEAVKLAAAIQNSSNQQVPVDQ